MNNKELNKKEKQVYDYIKKFINKKHYSPSYREILKNTEYKSVESVFEVINKLISLDLIVVDKNEKGNIISRSIRLN